MNNLVSQLIKIKLIPVIAIDNAEDIIPLGKALVDNGLPAAEITFRSAAAEEAIRLLRKHQPEMMIGAGTVLNQQQVLAAKAAGASFVVSPGFNPTTVRVCRELNMPIIPGVNNPSTIEAALEMGLSTLKFFPAEASGGVAMIKALLAPYTDVKLMPTGGITTKNICDYLTIPRVIACGGTWMVDKQLIENKDWEQVGKLTREAVSFISKIDICN